MANPPATVLSVPKLSDFISLAKNNGFARANRFLVEFFPPTAVQGISASVTNQMNLLCEEATFPGKSINTTSLRIAALSERRASFVDYKNNEITFKFIIDTSWKAKQYFNAWMSLAVNPMNSYGEKPKEVGFYESYIGDVHIFSLAPIFNATYNRQTGRPANHNYQDPTGNIEVPLYGIKLVEAWPTAMSSQQMSSSTDGYHHLDVTFTFKWWEDVFIVDTNSTAANTGQRANKP